MDDKPAVVLDVKQLAADGHGGIVVDDPAVTDVFQTKSSMPVTYTDVCYTVTNSAKRKEKIKLLDAVDGLILPGQLTALMGPSGSGKTTLLDVLAGRKTVGKVEGSILFAGKQATPRFLRRYSAYVEQQDTLIANLTVEEMLRYTIELKVEAAVPMAQKRAKVDAVISQLNLDSCRGVRIGNVEQRGISGGQAKRVNVGLALVSNPRVLFLDEPTSGLDSFTANEVLTAVKALVREGISICSTIHSPTSYCFGLFDRLSLLIRGRVVYCGPNGEAAIAYFQQTFSGSTPFGKQHHNPAEWIVDLTTQADKQGQHRQLADAYDASEVKAAALAQIQAVLADSASNISPETLRELAVSRATTNSFASTLWTLFKYRVGHDLCDPAYLIPRAAEKLIFALIILALYWKVGRDFRSSAVNNLVSVLFMWAIMPAYSAAAYIPALCMERPLYVRERADGLHRAIAYLAHKMLGEVAVTVFVSLAASAVVFYSVRLSGSFLFFWLNFMLTSLCGVALGYVFACWSPSMEVANAALPLYVTILLFFTGLLIRPADQPAYVHWFAYIDFVHYAWAGMMINEFRGTDQSGALAYNNTPVLEFYSMADSNKWEQLGWLCVFFAAFMAIAWAALAFRKLQRR